LVLLRLERGGGGRGKRKKNTPLTMPAEGEGEGLPAAFMGREVGEKKKRGRRGGAFWHSLLYPRSRGGKDWPFTHLQEKKKSATRGRRKRDPSIGQKKRERKKRSPFMRDREKKKKKKRAKKMGLFRPPGQGGKKKVTLPIGEGEGKKGEATVEGCLRRKEEKEREDLYLKERKKEERGSAISLLPNWCQKEKKGRTPPHFTGGEEEGREGGGMGGRRRLRLSTARVKEGEGEGRTSWGRKQKVYYLFPPFLPGVWEKKKRRGYPASSLSNLEKEREGGKKEKKGEKASLLLLPYRPQQIEGEGKKEEKNASIVYQYMGDGRKKKWGKKKKKKEGEKKKQINIYHQEKERKKRLGRQSGERLRKKR